MPRARRLAKARRLTKARRPVLRLVAFALLVAACRPQQMPDPRLTVEEYERAIEQGDVTALRALMTDSARQAWTKDELQDVVERDQQELQRRARKLSSEDADLSGVAELYYEGGLTANLVLTPDGHFRIGGTGALPARPRTPRQALAALERALRLQSLDVVLALLSAQTRQLVEDSLADLLQALAAYESAVIVEDGPRAVAELLGGYRILLAKKDGYWQVEDIE